MLASAKSRILLVEDNLSTARLVHEVVRKLQAEVISVRSLEESYRSCARGNFDVAIIDRKLTDGDGMELVAFLQDAAFATRVLVVSHLGQATDRVQALEAGADDCLAKPFSPGELLLRTKKLLQVSKQSPQKRYSAGQCTFVPDEGLFTSPTFSVQLQRREAQILEMLWQRHPALVSRAQIISKLWGDSASLSAKNTVEVYVRRLRIHLGPCADLIGTVRGYGYQLLPNR